MTRFHGNQGTKQILDKLKSYKPDGVSLESVQHQLLLRKVVALASEQLESGEYDLSELSKYTTVIAGGDSLVRPLSSPKEAEKFAVTYMTGIPHLDQITQGIHDELIIVSARPKQGKSNFFVNLVCLQPKTKFLYITVADYGYNDLCRVIADCSPKAFKSDNILISDFTASSATLVDIESAIQQAKPDVVIVDRAEKLFPLRKKREVRHEVSDIFEGLRRLAKKFHVPVITDSQQSGSGQELTQKKDDVSPDFMAEDRTGRFAVLDLFIGLQRLERKIVLHLYGRRNGLPAKVTVATDNMGRFIL